MPTNHQRRGIRELRKYGFAPTEYRKNEVRLHDAAGHELRLHATPENPGDSLERSMRQARKIAGGEFTQMPQASYQMAERDARGRRITPKVVAFRQTRLDFLRYLQRRWGVPDDGELILQTSLVDEALEFMTRHTGQLPYQRDKRGASSMVGFLMRLQNESGPNPVIQKIKDNGRSGSTIKLKGRNFTHGARGRELPTHEAPAPDTKAADFKAETADPKATLAPSPTEEKDVQPTPEHHEQYQAQIQARTERLNGAGTVTPIRPEPAPAPEPQPEPEPQPAVVRVPDNDPEVRAFINALAPVMNRELAAERALIRETFEGQLVVLKDQVAKLEEVLGLLGEQ